MFGSCMRLLNVFDKHCSTSNTMHASYDVTAIAIIKPRLADPLLQSGVVIRNSRI